MCAYIGNLLGSSLISHYNKCTFKLLLKNKNINRSFFVGYEKYCESIRVHEGIYYSWQFSAVEITKFEHGFVS